MIDRRRGTFFAAFFAAKGPSPGAHTHVDVDKLFDAAARVRAASRARAEMVSRAAWGGGTYAQGPIRSRTSRVRCALRQVARSLRLWARSDQQAWSRESGSRLEHSRWAL